MNRKHSIFYIATQWMQNNKPCIHGKGQRCIWIESSKECQDCMMAERTMVKKGYEQREDRQKLVVQ